MLLRWVHLKIIVIINKQLPLQDSPDSTDSILRDFPSAEILTPSLAYILKSCLLANTQELVFPYLLSQQMLINQMKRINIIFRMSDLHEKGCLVAKLNNILLPQFYVDNPIFIFIHLANVYHYKIQMQGSKRVIHGKNLTYNIAEMLGQGQFGKVYRAQPTNTEQSVAIKIIRRNKFLKNEKLKQLLERQMMILAQFNHEHVIQLLEAIVQKQQICIVYEYCDGGTLQDKIPVPEGQLMTICWQIIDAMIEAEEKFVIHRDLKPANILFKEGKVKIADWGFSRFLQNGQTTCSFIGSPAYMAPEALKSDEYSQKADIWSLGIVIYQSLIGTCPWKSHNISSLTQEIKKAKITFPKDKNISEFWQEMITDMLSFSPYQRPTCKDIKQRLSRHIKIPKTIKNIDQIEQQKILSCVFFLQIVQWSRKNIINSYEFQLYIKLVEQNLLKLRSQTKQRNQLLHILEKQIKVVNRLKRKIQQRTITKQKSLTNFSLSESVKTGLDQQNPEGLWEELVKKTVKYVIDELQFIYKDRELNKKQQKLVKLNIILDLVVFADISKEYLQKTFQNYLLELAQYHKKNLLKLINYKLQLINKRYYQ